MITDRSEFLGAVRQVLYGIAEWTEWVFQPGAGCRLLQLPSSVFPTADDLLDGTAASYHSIPWTEPGCVGSVIEESMTLRRAGELFDFAITGIFHGAPDSALLDARHEIIPLAELIHQPGLCSPIDAVLPERAMSQIREVIDLINARAALHEGGRLSLPQIAVLAGLSEKTVRMAAMGRDRDPELRTYSEGNRTWVDSDEALRWLSTKKGFKPNVFLDAAYPDSFMPASVPQLQAFLLHLRQKAEASLDQLSTDLCLSEDESSAYAIFESAKGELEPTSLTPSLFLRLAQHYSLPDAASFARNASLLIAPLVIDQQLKAAGDAVASQKRAHDD